MFCGYGFSDKGRARATNEDCFAVDDRLRLSVVADGLGGHNAGEIASRLAVDTITDYIRQSHDGPAGLEPFDSERWPYGFDPALSIGGNRLRTAVHLANARVLEASLSDDDCRGMGTTVVVALMVGRRLSVGHVGDSRLYIASEGRVRQLTDDDSWMATVLAQDPALDRARLRHHPMHGALTNVIGGRSGTGVHVVEEDLFGNELLLLSTDGVHGVLEERHLARLMAGRDDPRVMAERIVNAAIARGSHDNCTAVVARYVGGAGREPDGPVRSASDLRRAIDLPS